MVSKITPYINIMSSNSEKTKKKKNSFKYIYSNINNLLKILLEKNLISMHKNWHENIFTVKIIKQNKVV